MSNEIRLRPARVTEIETLARLIKTRLPDMMSGQEATASLESRLKGLVQDSALLLATAGSRLAGMIALDIDRQRILACYLDPEVASPDTPKKLFRGLEQVAVTYGIRTLQGLARKRVVGFMKAMGYAPIDSPDEDARHVQVSKDLLAEADEPLLAIIKLCDEIGIPANYGVVHRMQLVIETSDLQSIGNDIYGREQKLSPSAADAWARMRAAASNAGVDLQLVSGFRSIAYQTNLIMKKIEQGQSMHRILRVSAPPGYSEHHSGRAVDITTQGCRPLEEEFASSKAYGWLQANARFFGFRESYTRNNRHQMAWEPWHWCYFRTT